MDTEQAKIILSAWRTGHAVPVDDPALQQALALLESDAALAKWFEKQSAYDDKVSAALRAIEPPEHLRESILAAIKVAPLPSPPTRRFPIWLAVAASLVLATGAAWWLTPRGPDAQFTAIRHQAAWLTEVHGHSFGSRTGDMEKIRAWLADRGGAQNFVVPKGLANLGGIGCEITSIAGTKVSLLCFHAGKDRSVHLYVMDRAQLAHPPPSGRREMSQEGAYALASWSEGDYSYILAQRGTVEDLPKYF